MGTEADNAAVRYTRRLAFEVAASWVGRAILGTLDALPGELAPVRADAARLACYLARGPDEKGEDVRAAARIADGLIGTVWPDGAVDRFGGGARFTGAAVALAVRALGDGIGLAFRARPCTGAVDLQTAVAVLGSCPTALRVAPRAIVALDGLVRAARP